jgi:GNAT superfamily N-acetyltransferase
MRRISRRCMTSRRNKMDGVRIRPYETKDKEALTAVCEETAWESYKKDRRKLATVPINFLDYFLEYEPSHVLVAADSGDRAVGYVECTTSYSRFVKTTKKVFFPRLRAVDPSQIAFEKRFLFALHFIRRWPAHLHINLTAAYQHQGLGSRLISALIDQLRKEGFTRLAICGVERGSASYGFYRHYGFKEIWVYSPKLVSLGIRFGPGKEEKA